MTTSIRRCRLQWPTLRGQLVLPELFLLLVPLVVSACAADRARDAHAVDYTVVEEFHARGDRIDLQLVTCDPPVLLPGSKLRVRGTYVLESHDEAWLYFGLTNGAFEGQTTTSVKRGRGSFDVTMRVTTPGLPHVSLYAGSAANNCIGKCRFELLGDPRATPH